jgi:Ran GTPase-activating protein (RanGAP) involved in mRNA processing and transport
LQELYFAGNHLHDDLCPALAASLSRVHALQILDLNLNRIFSTGAMALCECFHSLPSLSTLILSSNRFEDSGCCALAKVFPRSLTHLDLSWKNIGDEGLVVLMSILLTRSSPLEECSLLSSVI